MKIQLTDEQISLLISNETEKLQQRFAAEKQRLEKRLEADLKDLNKKLEADTNKLTNKYKFIEVADPTPSTPRIKLNKEVIKQMVAEKKTVKEMADCFKTSESSIRSKLFNMNIKLTETN